MKSKNYSNKFWHVVHIRNLIITIIGSLLLLYVNENVWPKSHFFKEFVIVVIAAFAVSAYFEFYLRKGISEDNMKFYEMKEELGKAGILKYFSNFKDLDLRSYFRKDVKFIDIYVHFGDTVFSQISDEVYKFCAIRGNELNIYMLSPDNKFILGLGELWGTSDSKYNEDGIKNKIKSAQQTVVSVFDQLKKENKLKATVNLFLLKKNPVFYSFYRFDNAIIYVPSKIVENRIVIPPAFLLLNTYNDSGLFSKCLRELELIKGDPEKNLDLAYKN